MWRWTESVLGVSIWAPSTCLQLSSKLPSPGPEQVGTDLPGTSSPARLRWRWDWWAEEGGGGALERGNSQWRLSAGSKWSFIKAEAPEPEVRDSETSVPWPLLGVLVNHSPSWEEEKSCFLWYEGQSEAEVRHEKQSWLSSQSTLRF